MDEQGATAWPPPPEETASVGSDAFLGAASPYGDIITGYLMGTAPKQKE